jgi:hypothetical protein
MELLRRLGIADGLREQGERDWASFGVLQFLRNIALIGLVLLVDFFDHPSCQG